MKLLMNFPFLFHDFFEALIPAHQYDTRQASKGDIFMTHKDTLQYGLRSVKYADAVSWNSITDVIKESPKFLFFVVNSNLRYSLQTLNFRRLLSMSTITK